MTVYEGSRYEGAPIIRTPGADGKTHPTIYYVPSGSGARQYTQHVAALGAHHDRHPAGLGFQEHLPERVGAAGKDEHVALPHELGDFRVWNGTEDSQPGERRMTRPVRAPLGGVAPMAAWSNTGTSGVRSSNRLAAGGSTAVGAPKETSADRPAATTTGATGGTPSISGSAMPMSMPLAGRGQGADDAEYQRRYEISDDDSFTAEEQPVLLDSGVITSIAGEEPGEPAP